MTNLLLCLPFGAAATPPKFCIASKVTCDIANELMLVPTWDPSATASPLHHLLPPLPLQDASIPFATALLTLNVAPPTIDIIIFFFFTLPTLSSDNNHSHCYSLHILPTIHQSESHCHPHILSLCKLVGKAQLSETKQYWVASSTSAHSPSPCQPPTTMPGGMTFIAYA